MMTLTVTLRPRSAFGTPLAGDTLFGHLCWAARERYGEARLTQWLRPYTEGRPFLVVSDGFPSGCLPRPTVPEAALGLTADPARRKLLREQCWLRAADSALPLSQWLPKAQKCDIATDAVITQNTINRITGTTGTGQFAPRQVDRTAYEAQAALDVHAVFDEAAVDEEEVGQLFADVGMVGYGRDASTGLGKFDIDMARAQTESRVSRHWLTLAPCAPDPLALDAARCYYQPVTRFGRHGNFGARLGQPFKRPILMMKTGALLTARQAAAWSFHGCGLGGRSSPLSFAIPGTVHQGYAPVVPVTAELA